MGFIRKNSRLLFILILPVYFYIVQSSILNRHTHFYPNGMVVTHSHPLSDDSENQANNHQHTKTEICFFAGLHFDYYLFTPEIRINFTEKPETQKFCIFQSPVNYSTEFHIAKLRGPPQIQV